MIMANKLINLRMSNRLIKESQETAREFGFNNTQELIRESLRNAILEYKRKKTLFWLERNFASIDKIKRLTKEEKRVLFKQFNEKKSDKAFNKLGIKPDII